MALYNIDYAAKANFVLCRGNLIPCEVGVASTTDPTDYHLLVVDLTYQPFSKFDHHVNRKAHHGIRWPQQSLFHNIQSKCGAKVVHKAELARALGDIVGKAGPGEWSPSIATIGKDQDRFFKEMFKTDAVVVDVSGVAPSPALKPTRFQNRWDEMKPELHLGFHATDALATCSGICSWNLARLINPHKVDDEGKRRMDVVERNLIEYWD